MIIERLSDLLVRHRLAVALAMAALTLAAAYGYVYEPAPSSDPLRRASDENRPRLQAAEDAFNRRASDCLLVIDVDDLFRPQAVAGLRRLAEAVESLDFVESLTWIDNTPSLNAFGLSEPLLPPADASPGRFEDSRRRTLSHPLVVGQLLSEDGETLLMPIRFDWLFVTSDADCTSRLIATAESAMAPFDVNARVRLTGPVPLYLAYQRAFDRNQIKFQILAYGITLLAAVILFRQLTTVLIVSAAPSLAVFWSVGILHLLDEMENPLTVAVLPVLVMMVGLTDGIHLMVHLQRLRAEGLDALAAARAAIRRVGLACMLTSLTTAIGFGSLMAARSEFVQGFGRACAIGVVITFFAVIAFIPLICTTRLGANIHLGRKGDLVDRRLLRLDGLIDFVLRRPRTISLLGVAATMVFAAIGLNLHPDDKTQDSQPTGSKAYRTLAHCDEVMGGIEFVQVRVEWDQTVTYTDENVMEAIIAAENVVDAEPLLQYPLSIRNILATFPGDSDLASRMSFVALLPDDVKNAYFNTEDRRALIRVRMRDLGIARYLPVFERVENRLTALSASHPGFQFVLAGQPVERSRTLYGIVVDLAASLGTASVIILLVMTVVYRSLRIGLITVVPNMFPLAVTATTLVLTGQALDIASVCAFTVCLGIAVDDSIHFLTRFQDEIQTSDAPVAIQRTAAAVGSPLIMTTIILVSGFGTVLTSEMPGHRAFAAMACSTITAALVGDLIFLPAMLAWAFGKKATAEAPIDRSTAQQHG